MPSLPIIERTPRRPRVGDPDVLDLGARLLLKEIEHAHPAFSGLGERGVAALRRAMALSGDLDGYRVARVLDRDHGWEIGADLVATLDGAWSCLFRAESEKTRQWVERHGISPSAAPGDRVRFGHRGEDYEGEVVGVDPSEAKVHVFCEALGHVRAGRSGTMALILPHEAVERIP